MTIGKIRYFERLLVEENDKKSYLSKEYSSKKRELREARKAGDLTSFLTKQHQLFLLKEQIRLNKQNIKAKTKILNRLKRELKK
jgi:hypothetical protein